MNVIAGHLSVEELEERHLACLDAAASRYFQTIWLLAKGRGVRELSDVVEDRISDAMRTLGPYYRLLTLLLSNCPVEMVSATECALSS